MASTPIDWHARARDLRIDGRSVIDGVRRAAQSGETFACLSPLDGRSLGEVARGREADVDAADAGKVAPNWQDIRATNLKGGYGFGVRVHSEDQNFARIDVGGGGGEGWRVFLKLGPTF